MDKSIYILILVVMGLVVAYTTTKSSNKREKIHGGAVAQGLHYLAAGLLAMLAPTVLCNVIFIHPNFLGEVAPFGWNITPFAHAVVIALMMLAIAIVLLIPFALTQKPALDALAKQEDKGWTKEDAETSGL